MRSSVVARSADVPLFWATVGLLIANGSLAWTAWRQRTHIERQAEAVARQAHAAEVGAEASRQAVAEMREQRAAANPLELRLRVEYPARARARFVIFNGGSVPVRLHEMRFDGPSEEGVQGAWGYQLLAPGDECRDERDFDPIEGQQYIVTIIARPAKGLRQAAEFLYRVDDKGDLVDLQQRSISEAHWIG